MFDVHQRPMPEPSPTSPDESTLVRRAQSGDHRAFGDLVSLHQRPLLRFLQQRAASHSQAEDALQETFVKAYRNLARYSARWRFSTWLFTIGQRELASLQRRKRLPSLPLEAASEVPAPAERHPDTPPGLWAIARKMLGDDQYAALWLFYGEEMSAKQIARILARSRVWVRVSLLRSRRALRKALQQDQQQPNRTSSLSAEVQPLGQGGAS